MNTDNWTYQSQSQGAIPVHEMHHDHLVNADKKVMKKLKELRATPEDVGNIVSLSVEVRRRNIKISPKA